MEIYNPGQYSVGLGQRIQFNKFGNKIYFGQTQGVDSFKNNSVERLCNEFEIKKMIMQNPEVKKILTSNKMPVRLNMVELRDLMDNHSKDTMNIAVGIAANLPEALKQRVNMKDLKDGAMLHDFGKVLIPPQILNKNGPLTVEEHKIMDLHTELGYQLLKNSGISDEVLNLVRYHHDNFDGTDSVRKNFIPDINLQILNLADKYSALTEKRVYKEAYSPKKALTILYSDVKRGNVHPFLFQALVKSLESQAVQVNVNKC